MVKIENLTNQPESNQNNPPTKKEESGLIKTIGQLLPLAPFVYEQFTGQKVPPMTGTMADI
ncbi:6903_t:CDS:1, partial [Ambispora leptoticha]